MNAESDRLEKLPLLPLTVCLHIIFSMNSCSLVVLRFGHSVNSTSYEWILKRSEKTLELSAVGKRQVLTNNKFSNLGSFSATSVRAQADCSRICVEWTPKCDRVDFGGGGKLLNNSSVHTFHLKRTFALPAR